VFFSAKAALRKLIAVHKPIYLQTMPQSVIY
jgi:hypothetical protein